MITRSSRTGVRILLVMAAVAALMIPAAVKAEAASAPPYTFTLSSSSTSSVKIGSTTVKPGQKVTVRTTNPTAYFGSSGQKCNYSATNAFTYTNGSKRTTKTSGTAKTSTNWGTSGIKSASITLKVTGCYTPKKVTAKVSEVASGSVSASVNGGSMGKAPRTTTFERKNTSSYYLPVKTSRSCKVTAIANGKAYLSTTQKTSHSIKVPYSSTVSVIVSACK